MTGRAKNGRGRPKMLYEKESSGLNCLFFLACLLVVALLLYDLQFTRRYMVVQVSGGSMEVTLFDGDVLFADRYAEPKRGDVVIVNVTNYRTAFGFRGDYIIKRLIAVEGDSVLCDKGTVYVRQAGTENFLPLEEPYTSSFVTEDFSEIKVGEGEIFFLGDHRTNSTDSRAVGCLKKTDIAGVVPQWAIKIKPLIGVWEKIRNL